MSATPEGERKLVTVLFADVARSMELAERFEADEWTEIMRRLSLLCRAAVVPQSRVLCADGSARINLCA